jgi:group I intron endonuclease
MTGIIYKITNLINNKAYIGQTIQPIKDRWYRHCGKTGSKQELDMPIKRAILKYGKENFSIEILEEVDRSLLDKREIYYIELLDSYNKGYNATLGGQKGAKLIQTPIDQQMQIIDMYHKGSSLRSISKVFNIDKTTVKGILVKNNVKLRTTRTYKLTQENRNDIIDDFNSGLSRKEIMAKYKISKSYLSQLITGSRRI